MTLTINFNVVDAKNPKNEPNAAFNALVKSILWVSSPIKAPKKAPMINPKGIGLIKPIIKPSVVPIAPALLPPNFFVPMAGMM